ncbi:zf-TFIIB domain-containing protein [Siccirubricoccus sp. KC 17139]|uniref:Zf-TFIIB domain-containing protein n=1 Tax=Siccirubricoccus soli TaxID=2899147 RepID=A0ABT1D544_9PROT|nr:zf-TFIIB domain-containing protein [Siccirubricoccus soli]MCO6416115.1 zf-TFIIB domain-containing protein [Siccirubricoccus soli]MCP2682249.1 zf-TFIIB domain-containing protein [Siccirubricoccus soli]
MHCPGRRVDLVAGGREGIRIDRCPECRGVWLGCCEFDKLIDHGAACDAPSPSALPAPGQPAGGWTQPSPPPLPRGHREGGLGHQLQSWLRNLFE